MSSTSNFRKRLDALIQNGKAIKKSAETTLAWRSLQMAKAWLERAASYQSNASIVDTAKLLDAEPYLPSSKISEIPPTANVAEQPLFINVEDHLSSVNQMRDRIQSEIESIEGVIPVEERQRHCYQNCLDHLIEARMWYGFELQELREQALEADRDSSVGYSKFVRPLEEIIGVVDGVTVETIAKMREQSPLLNEAVARARHVDGVSEDYIIRDTPLDGGSVLDEKPAQDTSTAGLLDAKNSEDENKDRKKEQPGAPKKKG